MKNDEKNDRASLLRAEAISGVETEALPNRGEHPRYAAIGPGFSGVTDSREEAELWIANNKGGALYGRAFRDMSRYRENLEVALIALIAVCRRSSVSETLQHAINVAEDVLINGCPTQVGSGTQSSQDHAKESK